MKLLIAGFVLLISYSVLVLQFYSASKKGYNSMADVVFKKGRLAILNQRHGISLLTMMVSVLCIAWVNPDWLLLRMPNLKSILFTIVLGVAACIIAVTSARKALRNNPPAHSIEGSVKTYLFIRALFITFYEIFFRAALLNVCIAFANIPIVIAINVVLYALAHAFSTRQELLGTLPFGILLCGLTLYSASILPAVLIHLLLALPYDALILTIPKHHQKTFLL